MMFTVAHYFIMKTISRKEGITEDIFDMKFILIVSATVLVITTAFSFIYSSTIIRYSVLLLLLGVIVLKRRYFFDTLKVIKEKPNA